MASRDKGQGFGFMYVDIEKLLAQRDELAKAQGPVSATNVHTINFNKDPQGAQGAEAGKPRPMVIPAADPIAERKQAIHQIRENLDRLQSLHHKLHAMLADLNGITNTDKKKN